MRRAQKALLWVAIASLATAGSVVAYCHGTASAPSTCYGTPAAGAVEGAWQLPRSGVNFGAYSSLGWSLGRTYVHSAVHPVVLEAYAGLQLELPGRQFLYGETGFVRGGQFRPHRTHQNGLSVDFMVPVVNADGRAATLPTSAANKFGYDIDFDANGKNATQSIDFEAIALHLAQLQAAAQERNVRIAKVIFAPDLQPHLRRTKAWSNIRSLPFNKRPSWVRHDDHYHVDFAVPCQPLAAAP